LAQASLAEVLTLRAPGSAGRAAGPFIA